MKRASWAALDLTWDAIRAALAAAGFTYLEVSTSAGRDAIHSLCRLAWWLVRTASSSGLGHAMTTLKQWSSDLRFWVVTGVDRRRRRGGLARFFQGRLRALVDSDDKAAQISYLGRALPEGHQGVQMRALRKHRAVLTSCHATDPTHLRDALRFAREWANEHLRDPLPAAPTMASGSCLEHSRAEGGHLPYTAEVAGRVESLRQSEEWKARVELVRSKIKASECHIDIEVRNSFIREELYKDLLSEVGDSAYPRCEALVIPERGFKARVVTKSHSSLISLGHYLRQWLLRGLERDGRIRRVLSGDHGEAVQEVTKGPRRVDTRVLLSSDLTAASDLLPHDLVAAIVEGVLESRPAQALPEWARETFRLLTGPQRCSWPALGSRESVTTTRGIMMGLPTTWTILCLVQLYWARQSWKPLWDRAYRTPRVSGRSGYTPATAICGDDLLGWWPREVANRYDRLVAECGGEVSVGKHFRSSRYAVFTEEIYKLRLVGHLRARVGSWERLVPRMRRLPDPKGRPGRFRLVTVPYGEEGLCADGAIRLRAIPIRGLVRPKRLPGGRTLVPWWVALGPAAEMVAESTNNAQAVRRVLRVLWPRAWQWAREHGFAASLPRVFGGFGLPPQRGRPDRVGRLPATFAKGVAGLLYASQAGVRPPDAAWNIVLRPNWRRLARESADWKFGNRGVLVRQGRVPFNGRAMPLGDIRVTEDVISQLANELAFLMGPEPSVSPFTIAPASLARSVRRYYERICRRVRWVGLRGIAPSAPRRALRARLETVYSERIWWTRNEYATEGFVLGLTSSAKRQISLALGWATTHTARP